MKMHGWIRQSGLVLAAFGVLALSAGLRAQAPRAAGRKAAEKPAAAAKAKAQDQDKAKKDQAQPATRRARRNASLAERRGLTEPDAGQANRAVPPVVGSSPTANMTPPNNGLGYGVTYPPGMFAPRTNGYIGVNELSGPFARPFPGFMPEGYGAAVVGNPFSYNPYPGGLLGGVGVFEAGGYNPFDSFMGPIY